MISKLLKVAIYGCLMFQSLLRLGFLLNQIANKENIFPLSFYAYYL